MHLRLAPVALAQCKSKMKSLFETWRKYVDESKVVNLHRYAFNKASMDLYKWFEDIAYQDTSIDEDDPNYEKLVVERAEILKYAFLEKVENNGIELALEMIGIPVMYLGADWLGSLYTIMAEYEKRKAML